MKILVTGSAGFIGFHLVKELVKINNVQVTGLDNINDYYSIDLKYDRLKECGIEKEEVSDRLQVSSKIYPNYRFVKMDLTDFPALTDLFSEYSFDMVVNLAAQAGVRYSLDHPHSYIQSNILGFTNILECSRHHKIKHLIYASSSSVYGLNNHIPFSEDDNVDYPVSLYAATKKSNELLAHTYSHLFQLPCTGIRLFTVYGPWGRPDMAPMLFANAILKGETINVFNEGNMLRDFTYVEDIVEMIIKLTGKAPGKGNEHPYYQIFNIGRSEPVKLMDFLMTLENIIGKKAKFNFSPMQPGDVPVTYADTSHLEECLGCKPHISIQEGVSSFIEWFMEYYRYH